MVKPLVQQDDDRRVIYEQDMQSVRHHDSAKWSRFQTVSVIEGGALYAAFGEGLTPDGRILLFFAATMLIALVFVLAVIDDRITASYLARVREFEQAAGAPYPQGNTRPLFRWRMSRVVMATLLMFNVVILGALIGNRLEPAVGL